MRFLGQLVAPTKAGESWGVGVEILGIYSQGETREDALEMIRDAIEMASGVKVVVEAQDDALTVATKKISDYEALFAFMVRQNRVASGKTTREAAKRLHSKSPNAYARYEQEGNIPKLTKLDELFGLRQGEVVLGFIGKGGKK